MTPKLKKTIEAAITEMYTSCRELDSHGDTKLAPAYKKLIKVFKKECKKTHGFRKGQKVRHGEDVVTLDLPAWLVKDDKYYLGALILEYELDPID